MAKLLEAGFDIRKAAAVLMDTKLPPAQVALLEDLHSGLEAGQSITAAFGKNTRNITSLERDIIGAGERGGKLAPAFQHLANYFGMVASTRNAAVKGMIYPLVVLHMGVVISVIPGALMGRQGAGDILASLVVMLAGMYAVGFVIFLAARALLKMAPTHSGVDALLNRLPWIGKARRNMAMARFCKVYHSCILAGISMNETVSLASDASQSAVIRQAGEKLEAAAKSGEALGPRFMADAAFPVAFSRSYSTGEEAGTLDKDLGNWARLFQDEAEAAAKTASVMVPKVLYFFILLFVAWKIVSFFSGYYTSLDNIGN
ncbi:type II secretion system F family protein [Luteolibacter yonseiensis]|uniref:Type II secretion system F family protein n=1 Tax=Luteolibacter yonseiensis TaxID=1144680 RepID=A0A934R3I8_9BACT|nr:type II secretion system F family protein [Luteolibacter yonseiensis]MBK1816177.1 type II secretion system F family protein [Luteolibacter yonseiensis]